MRKLRSHGALIIATGMLFQLTGTCLPNNYFALTFRQASVAIANSVFSSALAQFTDSIGLTLPTDTVVGMPTMTDPNATP